MGAGHISGEAKSIRTRENGRNYEFKRENGSGFEKKKTDRIPVNHRSFSSKIASYFLGREPFVGGGIEDWREAKFHKEGWHDEYLERSFQDAIDIAFLMN